MLQFYTLTLAQTSVAVLGDKNKLMITALTVFDKNIFVGG